ncbi:hypothetical protein CTRI78_v008895 [Colletotrichum trifolii]|uniref:Protein kinase domain-containing protein n=1 Tax=Colletotrichum trifolii TaxID=5466 RepID=A0A4R8QS66_COLTR|nr:hypothetical protein CTRI78_v008895 [Colletotrichum trifolii]
MASQQYIELCRDIRDRVKKRLERRDIARAQFATRGTAESILESHYLRLFFQSVVSSDHAPPGHHQITTSEEEFVDRVQSRRLHVFIAILLFADCPVTAARLFVAKLVSAAWPVPVNEKVHDVGSLPAEKDTLRDFFDDDEDAVDKFYEKQAIFCTVVLHQREETIIKNGETQRLPYLEEKLLGSGSFGRVFKVKIAAGHIEDRHTDTVSNKEKWVARKDYIVQRPLGARPREEGEMMKMILGASKTCENIMENLGTLHVESPVESALATYSLFMPLAVCDLNAYMKLENHSTTKTAKTRASFMRSAMGLAAGLGFLHHDLRSTDLEDVVCYHMDLKPSNVLVFKDSDVGEGKEPRYVWKLSDFGMSRVKVRRRNHAESEERDFSIWFRPRKKSHEESHSATQNRRGQGTYLPRESFMTGKVMNTKSDVWSLGCVLSVVFAYLEGGAESIAAYGRDRSRGRSGTDEGFDGFFAERSFGRFVLHDAVKDWHHQLANKAGSRSPAEKRAVHHVLKFLEDKSLHVDQHKRCSARDVEHVLKETMEAYKALEHARATPLFAEEVPKVRRPSMIDKAKPSTDENSDDGRVRQWRLPPDNFDSLKGCKISPRGTVLVYWSDIKLTIFTSLSAPSQDDILKPADGFSLGSATYFWKAVALTERYLIASTTGGSFNCYVFDLEAGSSVDATLKTCHRVSLPFSEINNLAISPDHQSLVCTIQDMENERRPGFMFQARVTDLVDSGCIVNTEASDPGSNGTNTPLNFPQPPVMGWPAEDVISISLRSQTDGYMVVRPEFTSHDGHQVSIVSFSLQTRTTQPVDVKPQGIDANTASLFTAFSEFHHQEACIVVARERHLYRIDFLQGAAAADNDNNNNNTSRVVHKVIDKYRILKIVVNSSDDTLLAFGTKRAHHRIMLLRIKMPTAKDPPHVTELAQVPKLFDYDEFTVRLVDGDAKRYVLIAALD